MMTNPADFCFGCCAGLAATGSMSSLNAGAMLPASSGLAPLAVLSDLQLADAFMPSMFGRQPGMASYMTCSSMFTVIVSAIPCLYICTCRNVGVDILAFHRSLFCCTLIGFSNQRLV